LMMMMMMMMRWMESRCAQIWRWYDFHCLSLWSPGWRRRQSRFQSDSNCTSLGSSSCLISLSLSLTHTFSIFHNRSSTQARRTTTLVKWFHSNFTSRSFCKSHHETMFDYFAPCAHLCMHTREFNLQVKKSKP
jgi:hypothetical protein